MRRGVKVNKDNLLFFTIKQLWDGGRRKIRNSYHMVHFKLDSRPVKKRLSSDTKLPDRRRHGTARGPGLRGPPGPLQEERQTTLAGLHLHCEDTWFVGTLKRTWKERAARQTRFLTTPRHRCSDQSEPHIRQSALLIIY